MNPSHIKLVLFCAKFLKHANIPNRWNCPGKIFLSLHKCHQFWHFVEFKQILAVKFKIQFKWGFKFSFKYSLGGFRLPLQSLSLKIKWQINKTENQIVSLANLIFHCNILSLSSWVHRKAWCDFQRDILSFITVLWVSLRDLKLCFPHPGI